MHLKHVGCETLLYRVKFLIFKTLSISKIVMKIVNKNRINSETLNPETLSGILMQCLWFNKLVITDKAPVIR